MLILFRNLHQKYYWGVFFMSKKDMFSTEVLIIFYIELQAVSLKPHLHQTVSPH